MNGRKSISAAVDDKRIRCLQVGQAGCLLKPLRTDQDVLYSADPDVILMLRIQRDDPSAFAELVERYWNKLFDRFYRQMRDRQEAEDLTQEVFLRLYRHRKRYRPQARFATWLFHITHNVRAMPCAAPAPSLWPPGHLDPGGPRFPLYLASPAARRLSFSSSGTGGIGWQRACRRRRPRQPPATRPGVAAFPALDLRRNCCRNGHEPQGGQKSALSSTSPVAAESHFLGARWGRRLRNYPKTGTGTYDGYSFAALSVWQMLRIFFMTCIDLWHKTVIDPCQKIRKS